MKILNYGSLNLDHVYRVDHFVAPGETLASLGYERHCGGKGGNQSIALARAGAAVWHAGKIGPDGLVLRDTLAAAGVDVHLLRLDGTATGHAIIQVDRRGENAILLHGGANQEITDAEAVATLADFGPGDLLLLQNEISAIPAILRHARSRGLTVALNPAPLGPEVSGYPLEFVNLFILNEIEGAQLSGEAEPEAILAALRRRFPAAEFVLTLGAQGARWADADRAVAVPAERVNAVDTTAAGDTFIGFFLARRAAGDSPEAALRLACRAGAICVTRAGAAEAIPTLTEVLGA
jgi:ribokinase